MSQQVYAFYLPQFHEIPENNSWWGDGFTEWTNVRRAKPVYKGHNQPRVPGDLGYYSLETADVMKQQAALAKQHGVSGFIFYHYDFDGVRLLEKPVNSFLETEIDINFAICWANENWSRRWDGADHEILMPQNYVEGFESGLIQGMARAFKDPRYQRFEDKPVLYIYRLQDLPKPVENVKKMREAAKLLGHKDLYVIAVASFGLEEPYSVGADALAEFPPHGEGDSYTNRPKSTKRSFTGHFFDLRKTALRSSKVEGKSFDYYRCAIPSWDNTARKPSNSNIFLNASPELFTHWLRYLRSWANKAALLRGQMNLILINAWNEWAEGAYLEPDLANGFAYLNSVKESIRGGNAELLMENRQDLHEFLFSESAATEPQQAGAERDLKKSLRNQASVLKRVFGLVHFSTLRQVLFKLREDPTGKELGKAVITFFRQLTFVQEPPRRNWLQEDFDTDFALEKKEIVVVAHIFYATYIDKISESLAQIPNLKAAFISVPNVDIQNELLKKLSGLASPVAVEVIPNLGRNFFGLFTQFSERIKSIQYDYLIHVHSKKSPQAPTKISQTWARRLWTFNIENRSLISRSINFLEKINASVAYPDVTDLIDYRNFTWGELLEHAKKLSSRAGITDDSWINDSKSLNFPAGGMFIAKKVLIDDLLRLNLVEADYSAEKGQLSGQVHHAIERYVGELALSRGEGHLVYFEGDDRFYVIEES